MIQVPSRLTKGYSQDTRVYEKPNEKFTTLRILKSNVSTQQIVLKNFQAFSWKVGSNQSKSQRWREYHCSHWLLQEILDN